MQFFILLVAINSINFFIKIWRCVAAYRQVRNFVYIILKKTGRERKRYFGEKRIYHPALPVSNNLIVFLILV